MTPPTPTPTPTPTRSRLNTGTPSHARSVAATLGVALSTARAYVRQGCPAGPGAAQWREQNYPVTGMGGARPGAGRKKAASRGGTAPPSTPSSNQVPTPTPPSGEPSATFRDAQAAKLAVATALDRLALDRARGSLVEVDKVSQSLTVHLAALRQRLEQVPQEIEAALNELATSGTLDNPARAARQACEAALRQAMASASQSPFAIGHACPPTPARSRGKTG